jgi:phosphoribosylglycinamide formyltransferase-1
MIFAAKSASKVSFLNFLPVKNRIFLKKINSFAKHNQPQQPLKNLVLFASGSGTNAENIVLYFQNHPSIKIVHLFCNKPDAKVLEKMQRLQIPTTIFSKNEFLNGFLLKQLQNLQPSAIVLAGFLWKIPEIMVATFPNRIINIHPALLPKYGGKGMYGNHVHEAVLQNNEPETGITIHLVNEHYDEGTILFQAKCDIKHVLTTEEIAKKVHELEYAHFPKVIENYLSSI